MTHPPRHYAEALFEALQGKTAEGRRRVLKEFMAVLHKNRQSRILNQVLVQYEKVFLKKNNVRKVDVESASPLSDTVRREIEAAAGSAVLLTETVKPELIAGLTLLVDDALYIDASGRTRINNLFR